MDFWTNKKTLLTGGSGFLGRHVVEALERRRCFKIYAPTRKEYDLRNENEVRKLLADTRPDLVIHLAALCGGIEANRLRPGAFFYDNAVMGIQLIEQARLANIPKIVVLGTICAYPKFTPVPFKEVDFWMGYPEETNAPYGLAKKMLLVQLQAYRQQYGFHGIYLMPVNLYGPGDNVDLTTSHVIPAMIRKMVEAKHKKEKKVVLWGTGKVSREFLYVEDCAEGILMAAERYDDPEPVNLGSGRSVEIRELAQWIQRMVGFEGELEWDTTRPEGQPRRQLDVSRAKAKFGFEATTSLEEGLRKTVVWYESQYGVS